ncbi:hypothetical protein C8R43DRAFT_1125748 [Mycena crocata]|nr:hypothetical protein C8R43DRAFT_1125748 [Mycena crocata]
MTHLPTASSGTERPSVAAAAPSLPVGSDPSVIAAFFMNAMHSLAQGTQSPAAATEGAPTPEHQDAAPAPVPLPAPVGFMSTGPWVAGNLYLVVPTSPLLQLAEPEYTVDEGPTWYCITKGKYIGLTLSNALALSAVVGVSGGNMKGYKTQAAALAAFNEMRGYGLVAVVVI